MRTALALDETATQALDGQVRRLARLGLVTRQRLITCRHVHCASASPRGDVWSLGNLPQYPEDR